MKRLLLTPKDIDFAFSQINKILDKVDFSFKLSIGLLYSYVNLIYNFIVSFVKDPSSTIDHMFKNKLMVRFSGFIVNFSSRSRFARLVSPFWVPFFNPYISNYSNYIFALNHLGMSEENFKQYFPDLDFRDVSDEIVRDVLKDLENVSSEKEIVEKFVDKISNMLYILVLFGGIFFESKVKGTFKTDTDIPPTKQVVDINYYLGRSKNRYLDATSKISDHEEPLDDFFANVVAKLMLNSAYIIELLRFLSRRYSEYFGADGQRIVEALSEELFLAYVCASADKNLAYEFADAYDEFGNTPAIKSDDTAEPWDVYYFVTSDLDRNVEELLMAHNNRSESVFSDFKFIYLPYLKEVFRGGVRVKTELNDFVIPVLSSFFVLLRSGNASFMKKLAVIYVLTETAVFLTFIAEVLLDKVSRGFSYQNESIDNLHNDLLSIIRAGTEEVYFGFELINIPEKWSGNLVEYFIDAMVRSALGYIKEDKLYASKRGEGEVFVDPVVGVRSDLVKGWIITQAGYYFDKAFEVIDRMMKVMKDVFKAEKIISRDEIKRDKRFIKNIFRAPYIYDNNFWGWKSSHLGFLKAYILSSVSMAYKDLSFLPERYRSFLNRNKHKSGNLNKMITDLVGVFWQLGGKSGKQKASI